jgi:hypothetical protein
MILAAVLFFCPALCPEAEPVISSPHADAKEILREAVDYWRDTASTSRARMTVHRTEWERSSTLQIWTKGRTRSLVRFVSPAKDAGNSSLTIDQEMWSFSPKVNRTIKIPPSMKHQNWMGSDFSYEDLSKGDSILDDYTHQLTRTYDDSGHTIFVV